ncbi:MAG: hypothetical protein ABIY50_04475 [Ignavibacteria bacterium]
MKILKYLFILLFITSVGYAQNVKITDYKVSVSNARKLLLSGFHNWSQTGDSVTNNEFRLDGDYTQFYSSLPFAWNIDVNAFTSGKFNDTVRVGYDLSTDVRKYFANTTGFFGFAGLNSNYLRARTDSVEDRPSASVIGGLGYGRFLDATPMFKAIRIDQELRRSGITTKYMPKGTMLRIAEILDRESEYRDRYKDISEAKLIEAIMKEVVNSGASKSTDLSAFGYFRIRQVISGTNQFVTQRLYGGDVRVGVGYEFLTRNKTLKTPPATLNLLGRYSYPIDLRQQINLSAAANTPLDSMGFKLFEGQGAMDYSFTLTNKIQLVAGYNVNFRRVSDQRDIAVADHRGFAGMRFYLENYISLALTGNYEKPHFGEKRLSSNVSLIYTIL